MVTQKNLQKLKFVWKQFPFQQFDDPFDDRRREKKNTALFYNTKNKSYRLIGE